MGCRKKVGFQRIVLPLETWFVFCRSVLFCPFYLDKPLNKDTALLRSRIGLSGMLISCHYSLFAIRFFCYFDLA